MKSMLQTKNRSFRIIVMPENSSTLSSLSNTQCSENLLIKIIYEIKNLS